VPREIMHDNPKVAVLEHPYGGEPVFNRAYLDLADHYGFRPVVVGASVVPLFAMGLVLLLVRNTKYSGQGIILKV